MSTPTMNPETFKTLQGARFPSALIYDSDDHDAIDKGQAVPHPVAKFLDEIRCISFIQAVMKKPEWRKKLIDPDIVAKWKAESALREPIFEYAIKELNWLVQSGDAETGIEPTGVDFVWCSDKTIPGDLHEKFKQATENYASTLSEKDYHPGSDDQVVNLVHPSLFCLVYGKSTDAKGNVLHFNGNVPRSGFIQPGHDIRQAWSERYQWLPSEFLVDEQGKVKIASYINSLPANSGIYPIISQLFERAVPLFNRVLTDLRTHHGRVRFPRPEGYEWWDDEDTYFPDGVDWDTPEHDKWNEERKLRMNPLPIPDFAPNLFEYGADQLVKLQGCRLQVIVKIGSIELTPEKPSFPGGKWHIEGMANEKIVATAIYYYDSENIEDDCLSFRQGVEMAYIDFAQDDDDGATEMFGIGRDDPMVQNVGSVQTHPGRMLVFPNIYQHRVATFNLKDRSKPGHRKILVFFLVDPTQRIVSTATVPPQNVAWRDPELMNKVVGGLPLEIAEMITQKIGYEMTLEKAKEHRLKLMEERSVARDVVTNIVYERPFNLCEH